jgi:hypothetical protein
MIYSTKRDQYWSFWCQGWSNHHDQELLGGNSAGRAGEAGEANEVAEAAEVNEAAEVSWALKITFEDFRVIQVLEFYDLKGEILILSKKIFFDRIMKIPLNFSNSSFGGWWGTMSLFWKLIDETQIATPRKYTDAFIIIKKLFLGDLLGLQSNSNQYERPCTYIHLGYQSSKKCTMVFCYQNCSDLLWEKIVVEKNFWNSRLKTENLQHFWDH